MVMCEVEVWVVVNEDGDYVVGKDQETVDEGFRDDIGGSAQRTIKVTLQVPYPVVHELAGTVSDEGVVTLK